MTARADEYTLVPLAPGDAREVVELELWAFPGALTVDELLACGLGLPWGRAFGLRDRRGRLAGLAASQPFGDCPVPGARTAVAGLTAVSVHPEHRRRGLLTRLIGDHFARSLARSEAVSMLTATEAAIYQRFGYGLAARSLGLTVPRGVAFREAAPPDVAIRIEDADPERLSALVDRVHAAAAEVSGLLRPGWVTRPDPITTAHILRAPNLADGHEPRRLMIAERAGVPTAYAVFARHSAIFDNRPPGARVLVKEFATTDAASARALWGALTDLDLTASVTVETAPVDDPLLSLVVDVDALQARLGHLLWVRLLDVPAALARRRYAADVDVVLDVRDPGLPANNGRWRLTAAAFDQPTATRTDAPADLAMDVRDLAAVYLGGVTVMELAAAGRIEELAPGAAPRASVAFTWPVAPACSYFF